jgi:hypothetical protein
VSRKRRFIFTAPVVDQNPAQGSAVVRNVREGFREPPGKSKVFPTAQSWNPRLRLQSDAAVKKGRPFTLPLRSDDAGHRVEEMIESCFRLLEG